jgi:hypothetical protein
VAKDQVAPPAGAELVDDVSALTLGDLVREPGSPTWWLASECVPSGPDGVRPVHDGVALEVTVSVEAMRRATFGEMPAPLLRCYPLAGGAPRDLAPPLEELRDPVAFLRLQPVSPLVVTLLAWHVAADRKHAGLELELRELLGVT